MSHLADHHRRSKLLRGYCALSIDGNGLYLSRGTGVYTTDLDGRRPTLIGRVATDSLGRRWAARWRLSRRILRASVSSLAALSDGSWLAVFPGGVFRCEAGSRSAEITHTVERGTRPLSLAVSPCGTVAFGEYFSNPSQDEVHVYASADQGRTWHVAHTFPRGSIRHVHQVVYDRYDHCFWLDTGDCGDECQLLRANVDFSNVSVVSQGGQHNRFYPILPLPNCIVLGPDAPNYHNHIAVLDRRTGVVDWQQRIDNGCFSMCAFGSHVAVATTAERSAVNDTRACHIWIGDPDSGTWTRSASLPIDLPSHLQLAHRRTMGLFQFPRIIFPEGEQTGPKLIFSAVGLAGLDGATVWFDASASAMA